MASEQMAHEPSNDRSAAVSDGPGEAAHRPAGSTPDPVGPAGGQGAGPAHGHGAPVPAHGGTAPAHGASAHWSSAQASPRAPEASARGQNGAQPPRPRRPEASARQAEAARAEAPGRPPEPQGRLPEPPRRPEDSDVPLPPPRPLDAIDRDILQILQADGRASIRAVAERVHVSRANAYTRINRLMEDGVIRGFGARIHHERAGQGASAYITLKIVQNSWRRVREQLTALPGASHIALVSGDFDVLLLVHTADNRALRELVLTKLQSMPEILSTRTLLVFEEDDLEPEI